MNETEDNVKQLAVELWKFVWALMLSAVAMAVGGFVAMKLWNGLITPTFGLAELSYWQAFGLDVFVSFITGKIGNKDDGYKGNERLYLAITTSLLFWAVGSFAMMFI